MSFGFYLIDQFEQDSRKNLHSFESDKKVNILKFLAVIAPIYTQVSMYDGFGHYNVVGLVRERISKLKVEPSKNQYELFLLYFLLMDIDTENIKVFIDEAMAIIKLGVLKTSILFKLTYYLTFKAYNNPKLEKYLKDKIQTAKLNLDAKKKDLGNIHQAFEDHHKQNLLKGNKSK